MSKDDQNRIDTTAACHDTNMHWLAYGEETCTYYSGHMCKQGLDHSVNWSKSATLVAELVQVECVESSV